MGEIFITGGTGYMGRRLISILLKKGYHVDALVRDGSQSKLPKGCSYIAGNPFDASPFSKNIPKDAIFVQLLGVSHPGQQKKSYSGRLILHQPKHRHMLQSRQM